MPADAMHLPKRLHHVVKVLDDVAGMDFIECIVGKWPRRAVQIVDDIGADIRAHVEVDRSGEWADAASEIEGSGNMAHVGRDPRHADLMRNVL